jgi:ribosomal-protein-alanine N-acetyltransferase
VKTTFERLASKEDLDGVLAVEDASFNNPTTREWYEQELKRPEVCFVYVLRTPGYRVAAFCAFWLVADQAHINQLAVLPQLRGAGLGTQLLEAVIAEAAHLGAVELTLEVRASNQAALRLYDRAGFQRAGVRKNYYTTPIEDAYILIRSTVRNHS